VGVETVAYRSRFNIAADVLAGCRRYAPSNQRIEQTISISKTGLIH
jgi:hypothetical protein